VVDDFNDNYPRDFLFIDAAIFHPRNRIMISHEDQALWKH
jgi:hypothetical protein